MVDPLSIAASVAGLVSVALTILTMANDLCSTVKNAPDSIRRIIEEMRQMHCIFLQVQALISGTGTTPSHSRLSMISLHDLQGTLSGCVLLCDRLNRKLSEVLGLQSPYSRFTPSGVFSARGRVKWALWKESEAESILGDLERHKSSLNLMLTILQCTTIAGTAESVRDCTQIVAELRSLVAELMTITHQVLVDPQRQTVALQLHELMMRPPEVTMRRGGNHSHLLAAPDVDVTTDSSSSGGTLTVTLSSPSFAASSIEESNIYHLDSGDNSSIRTTTSFRSVVSMRSLRSVSLHFTEVLNNSRPYKRLRRACGRSSKLRASDAESLFSIQTGISRLDRWSTLSDLSLGDLSISQISVLELPLFKSDMWDSSPYEFEGLPRTPGGSKKLKEPRRSLQLNVISSSRGRIHNVIEANDEFTVRTLLTLGTEVIRNAALRRGHSTPGSTS